MKIGIEYQGQHHFKPVYGDKVFKRTIESDEKKLKIASEKDIKIVFIIPNGNVSKTMKTKIKNMFIKCCNDVGLSMPSLFDFSIEEVITEQGKNKPVGNKFINLGRKLSLESRKKLSNIRSKLWILKSPDDVVVNVNNLHKFCVEQNIQYTWLISQFKKGKNCKGWSKIKMID